MKLEFFSLTDKNGEKVVDCFKIDNTTYCDSPKNGPGLDVLKTESSAADRTIRDVYYNVRDRHVKKGVIGEIRNQVRFWRDSQYHVRVDVDAKRLQQSEPFFRKTLKESKDLLDLLSLVMKEQPEWELKRSIGDYDIYDATLALASQGTEGDLEVSKIIKVGILIPKKRDLNQQDFPLTLQIGEHQYRYQLQSVPLDIQKALRELSTKSGSKI